MADLVIRGMDMPKNCLNCRFTFGESFCDTDLGVSCYCMASNESKLATRPSRCPLVPLPEEHGRLIDADAYTETVQQAIGTKGGEAFILDLIEEAETIVPAEGGNADGNP